MPFVDTTGLKVIERLPGRKGRFFHTATMTFADYEFTAGSSIHEHFHPEEEVYLVIAGELEVQVDGLTQVVRPGIVAISPSNAKHSVKALTDGRVISWIIRPDRSSGRSSPCAGQRGPERLETQGRVGALRA